MVHVDGSESKKRTPEGPFGKTGQVGEDYSPWLQSFAFREWMQLADRAYPTPEGDFHAWSNRDLSSLKVVYLFLEARGLLERGQDQGEEQVLAGYGVEADGHKVLLHMGLGDAKSQEVWLGFLNHMVARGLREPLLVVSDNCTSLWRAARALFPNALQQACLEHAVRDILRLLPLETQERLEQMRYLLLQAFGPCGSEVLSEVRDCCYLGLRWGRRTARFLEKDYPAAAARLDQVLPTCLTYARFPRHHRPAILVADLLEMMFDNRHGGDEAIASCSDPATCLRLVHGMLLPASAQSHCLPMTSEDRCGLDEIRQELLSKAEKAYDEEELSQLKRELVLYSSQAVPYEAVEGEMKRMDLLLHTYVDPRWGHVIWHRHETEAKYGAAYVQEYERELMYLTHGIETAKTALSLRKTERERKQQGPE